VLLIAVRGKTSGKNRGGEGLRYINGGETTAGLGCRGYGVHCRDTADVEASDILEWGRKGRRIPSLGGKQRVGNVYRHSIREETEEWVIKKSILKTINNRKNQYT